MVSKGNALGMQIPSFKITFAIWILTSLVGKDLELLWEVKSQQLDLDGLPSTQSARNKLMDRGNTLSFSRVAQGEASWLFS